MANNLVYMFGKLSQAVGILVTNQHDVRERVWAAAKHLSALHPDAFPKSCRKDVEWILHMLTRYPAEWPYKSAAKATYQRTPKSTASKIAERVWTLYHLTQTELENHISTKHQRSLTRPSSGRAKTARR